MTTRADMVAAVRRSVWHAERAHENGWLVMAGADILEHIAALRAAAEALAAEEWRPIADCPEEWKDGRPVLLAHSGQLGYAYEAYWCSRKEAWYLANEAPEDYHARPIKGSAYVRLMPEPPPAGGG